MMDTEDLDWLRERAAAEYRMAREARTVAAQRSHFRIATAYSERAEELKRRMKWPETGQPAHF